MSFYFDTTIRGKKRTVCVTHYSLPKPLRITGSGMGDADPPEPEEFEYHLVNSQITLTEEEDAQVLEDYKTMVEGLNRGYD